MDGRGQERLAKIARRFGLAASAAGWGFAAAGVILLLVGPLRGGWFVMEVTGAAPPAFARLIAVATSFLTAVALLTLRSALEMIVEGKPFGVAVCRRMRQASFLMLSAAAISVGGPILMELAMFVAGHGPASVGASGSDVIWLVSAASFYLMSALIERAAEFETDSRQIV